MQLGLAKPSGDIWLPTSTIGNFAAIAFFTLAGKARLTRIYWKKESATFVSGWSVRGTLTPTWITRQKRTR